MWKCIRAGNYPVDIGEMAFAVKLNWLLKPPDLNENAKRNSLHILLNINVIEKEFQKKN